MSQSRITETQTSGKVPAEGRGFARIGILNDYVRVPYANGSSFASQLLYREFSARGHDVTVIGPHDPEATSADLPRNHLFLPSLPLRMHPGVHLPLPSRESLAEARNECGLDPVPFHKFAELVKTQVRKLNEDGDAEVAFRVAIKDGKVSLTARAMRGIAE